MDRFDVITIVNAVFDKAKLTAEKYSPNIIERVPTSVRNDPRRNWGIE